jgi:hypothetical protein
MNSDIDKDELSPATRDWLEEVVRPIAEQTLAGQRTRYELDSPEVLEEFRKEFKRQQTLKYPAKPRSPM